MIARIFSLILAALLLIPSLTQRAPAGSRRRFLTRSAGALGALAALFSHAQSDARKHGKKGKKNRNKNKSKKGPALRLAYECGGPPQAFDLYPSGNRLAQTFVANRSGTLRRVEIAIAKPPGSSGDWLVHLLATKDDKPSNSPLSVLASAAIPDADVPPGESVLTVNFSGAGPVLAAGTEYAVAIWRDGDSLGLGYRYHSSGQSCAGGLYTANGAGNFSGLLADEFDVVVSVSLA